MGERKTIHYFQWLRAIGAVAIVVLHSFITVHMAPDVLASPPYVTASGIVSITLARWAVPVFFMMSGALMLDPTREMGWRKMLRHVWRLAFVLLTFGFVFCLAEAYVDCGGASVAMLSVAVRRLLAQRSWDHMWFVYQLMGFYLITPLIRPWVAQASQEEYRRVVLVACLLLLGVNTISALMPYDLYYGFEVPHCFAYYLLGYYVHRYLRLDGRWLAFGGASLLTTVALWRVAGLDWATDPNRALIAPYAVLVMLLFKRYLERPIEGYPLMALLADYSFGIYLVHPAYQHLLMLVPGITRLPLMVLDPLVAVVSLVLSIGTVWVLRLLPGFKGKV